MENTDPAFDPYLEWFQITDEQRPPNHYTLLGLSQFEDDAEKIDQAAKDRSAYLHQLAAGPQRKIVQQVMTEIAVARRTLINPESRLRYDESLRQPTPEATSGIDEPAELGIVIDQKPARGKSSGSRNHASATPKEPSSSTALLLSTGSLTILVLVVGWMVFQKRGRQKAAAPMPARNSATIQTKRSNVLKSLAADLEDDLNQKPAVNQKPALNKKPAPNKKPARSRPNQARMRNKASKRGNAKGDPKDKDAK